jgi:VanZ family protein
VLPLQHSRRWRLAGAAVLALVMVSALMPAIWFWRDLARFSNWQYDKWLHLVIFLILAIWFSGQYSRRNYWRIAVGLFSFGVLIEISQRMVTYRTSDWMDLLADTVGILLGLAIALAGVGGWSMRFEQWLQDRAKSD